VTTPPDGKTKFIGVHFTAAALDGLPTDGPPAHTHLSLPDNTDTGAFEWVGMDWNPKGHEPPGIYTLPHFDFHFYMMKHDAVESIQGGPAFYDIPDNRIPTGHIRPPVIDTDGDGTPDTPVIIPKMGEHLLDPTASEFQGETFTHTHIWGAYDLALLEGGTSDGRGELTFAEPMVTAAFLEEQHEEVATSIPMPDTFADSGWYPTQYVIRYHDNEDAYTVTLESFEPFR
jgi:hypothetical protein